MKRVCVCVEVLCAGAAERLAFSWIDFIRLVSCMVFACMVFDLDWDYMGAAPVGML